MLAYLTDFARCVRRCLVFLIVVVLLACLVPATFAAEEEFVGPFASWLDVRRDFGASRRRQERRHAGLAAGTGRDPRAQAGQCALPARRDVSDHADPENRAQGPPGQHGHGGRRRSGKRRAPLGRPGRRNDVPVGCLVRQAFATDLRRRRPCGDLPALWTAVLHLQRNQRPGLARRQVRHRFRRPRYGRTGGERGPSLPLPAVRRGHPDRQLELHGHLGLVLPLRGLRPRHLQRDGQLARLGEPLPPLEDLGRQPDEPDGLLGGQQHQRRLEAVPRLLQRPHLGLAHQYYRQSRARPHGRLGDDPRQRRAVLGRRQRDASGQGGPRCAHDLGRPDTGGQRLFEG